MPNKHTFSESCNVSFTPIQAKYLYALVTTHIDHLTRNKNHCDLSPGDQYSHVVLGLIEEKLFEFMPQAV